MKKDFVFSSESVTEGHPDKLCDQISDALVDRFLQHDPRARIVAECAVANGIVFIAARFASLVTVDLATVARGVIGMAGYNQKGFDSKTCSIVTSLSEFEPERGHRCLEGDLSDEEIEAVPVQNQSTVFGFACCQSPTLIPLPLWLAHRLARRLASVRLQKILPYLAPDGKAQVAVEYRDGQPARIHSITVIASQQHPEPSLERVRQDVREAVVEQAFAEEALKPDSGTGIFINSEGHFLVGGPTAHAGLTGRKSAVDLYGEYARQSGAALSGKDPSRIERVGAYAARYAAKNVVAAGIATECEVQLSYSMGRTRPVSIQVETFGTGRIPDERIRELVQRHFDFRLAGIVQKFGLRRLPALVSGGFYRKLAAYGHVGRIDIGVPWELNDQVELLREEARSLP